MNPVAAQFIVPVFFDRIPDVMYCVATDVIWRAWRNLLRGYGIIWRARRNELRFYGYYLVGMAQ